MALMVCNDCSTQFAVGLPYCPQCTSDNAREAGEMPKITVHGGVSGVPDESTTVEEVGDYNELSVSELREECEARDLPKTGTKAELVSRLEEDDEAE